MLFCMQKTATAASTPAFARPTTPAAVCMHITRLRQPVTRSTLVELSGKSQPTVTRAVTALIDAKLVRERPDLSTPSGPGRPTIPIELDQSPWVQVGIAVGTKSTYIGAYNTRGQALREQFVEVSPAHMSPSDFVGAIAPHVQALSQATNLPLASIGMATSGHVSREGLVTASNLGWERIDIGSHLRSRFSAPLTITSVITAIAGAEQQLQSPEKTNTVLLFYVDDSNGAAVLTPEGVVRLDVANTDSQTTLGSIAVALAKETTPSTIVLAGSAFANPKDARSVALAIKSSRNRDVELRVIPTHLDNARAAARAVALDRLINDPLGLSKRMESVLENA